MKCPCCNTRELVEIHLTVRGEPMTLRSCSPCGQRWWEGLDGRMSLDSVLQQAKVS